MSINLLDLPAAVKSYMEANVTSSVSHIRPDVPGALSPGEGFAFDITARNAAGGIRLNNVRYNLTVGDDAIAKLIVPPDTVAVARASPGSTSTKLVPGTLVRSMVLFPVTSENRVLTPGESESIRGLRGIGVKVSETSIRMHVNADPDLTFLFGNGSSNKDAIEPVPVV